MFRSLLTTIACVLAFAVANSARADEFTLYAKFNRSGEIDGESPRRDRTHTITCIALKGLDLYNPGNSAIAASEFECTKKLGAASPTFMNALVLNDVASKVEIKLYRMNNQGQEEHVGTWLLTGARVRSMRQVLPNMDDPATGGQAAQEAISFSFETVTFTWVVTGDSATFAPQRR
jgi:type VI secretion system Hcp family effector